VRLGLVIYGDLATQTGGYLYDRRLVEHLQRAGDSVEILSLPWRSYGAHLADNLSRAFLRRLLELDVDLLLEDELNHPSLLAAHGRLRRTKRFPIVSIVHHLRFSEAWSPIPGLLYRLVERAYLQGVDAFIYNSQATRRSVERLAGIAKPFIVAPPGGDRLPAPRADLDLQARAGEPGPLRLLFVGSLIQRKGLHVLLEALAILPAGSVSLDVVGDGARDPAYAARIQRQITRLGLAGAVRLRGALSDDGLARAYARSHVLAVPSDYEGFGIAYLEAMVFGLPVLASAAGGATEIVTPGESGFLIPPGRPHILADHLRSLAMDRPLLARLSLAAQRSALARPGWADSMESIRPFLVSLGPSGAAAPARSAALGGVQ
jgi:glycosyltransferase involved in cell wall biosynthesis